MSFPCRGRAVAMALVLSSLLTACAPAAAPGGTRLTVFAAGSLVEAFLAVGEAFEAAHPDVEVIFNFAGSQQLVHQLVAGAPADVLATADTRQMQAAVDAGVVASGAVRLFAANRMVVVASGDASSGLTSFADLSEPGLLLVLAAPEVPAGRYAGMVLDFAAMDPMYGPGFAEAVRANVASEEATVRAVLTKVSLGEADVGIVYESDVAGPGGAAVRTIDIPVGLNVEAVYPIARVARARSGGAADAFVRFVLSERGQALLAGYGFMPPSGGD